MKRTSRDRFKVLLLLSALSFLLVEYKLVKLQLVDHGFWALESRKSRTWARSLPFERGWILDRNMTPLAQTQNLYELRFIYRNFRLHSPVGRISMILLLEEGVRTPIWKVERTPVEAIYANPEPYVETILALRPGDIEAVENRWQRTDLKDYLMWLFGLDGGREEALFRALFEEEAYRDAPFCRIPLLAAVREKILEDIRKERRAMERLEDLLGLERGSLPSWPDEEARTADRRVLQRLNGAEDPAKALSYLGYRNLHREFDSEETTCLRDVDHEAAAFTAVAENLLPGFYIVEKTKRFYPEDQQDVCPVLIGKTGLPNAEELGPWNEHGRRLEELSLIEDKAEEDLIEEESLRLMMREIDVRPDEEVGRMGLEAFLEPVIRGKRGYVIENRAAGSRGSEVIQFFPPIPGKDVVLTLDAGLQRACERALSDTGFPGSVVIMDVESGAVLAMATAPRPTRGQLATEWPSLVSDPGRPLLQRTINNYNLPPPGSVFKLVTSIAALEEGLLNPNETIECRYQIRVGPTDLHCDGTHDQIALEDAIAKSCNIYFYRVGELLGYEKLFKWAHHFGFGRATGVLDRTLYGMPGSFHAMLREADKELKLNESGLANLMRFAIGQGAIDDVTTMQVARMAAGIATGKLPQPHLAAKIGNRTVQYPPPMDLGISPDTLAVVRRAMREVVTRGTADPDPSLNRDLTRFLVAGKTGTPQVDSGLPDHASFAGYWPHESPRYSFAVFVEHCDLHGGDAAAPLLNRILEFEEARRYVEVGP